MQPKVKKYFFSIFYNFFRSIAFLPTLVSVFFIVLAFLILNLDPESWVHKLLDLIPFIEAREIKSFTIILTTLLAGLISLTIFSFSMVMIVMNQAATSYTPKILSLIVEQRSNQFVLGAYIGTILFYLIVLIYTPERRQNVEGQWLSFYLSIFFAMGCIILFVNFIHSVSVSVQIKSIVEHIFQLTRKKMQKEERKDNVQINKNGTEIITRFRYKSLESGYLQSYLADLPHFLQEKNLVIRLEASFGEYLLMGNDLFSTTREIDKETRNKIQEYLFFDPNENIDEHSFYGFYQLSEIAIKALSPGVNNIGIALICIDYLMDLFCFKAVNLKSKYVLDNDNNIRIITQEVGIQTIFYQSFTPIREYGKTSAAIIERLLRSFQKLSVIDIGRGLLKEELKRQAEAIVDTSNVVFKTNSDREHLNEIIISLNQYPDNYFKLPLLE